MMPAHIEERGAPSYGAPRLIGFADESLCAACSVRFGRRREDERQGEFVGRAQTGGRRQLQRKL